MTVKPLSERQLFQMKRVNLEKRITHYYSETWDSEAVIEYGMAILVLNAITMTNYSFVCKDLIKEIFLTSEPTDKMRNFCLYFYDFFEYNEWENIRDRLFKSRAEFSEWTRMIRPETKYVRAASAPTNKKRIGSMRTIGLRKKIVLRRNDIVMRTTQFSETNMAKSIN